MKYAIEMASDGMMYIPSFIKISSSIQKFLGGRHKQTHAYTFTEQGNLIGLFYFFKVRRMVQK
jgi:hypothetical protein